MEKVQRLPKNAKYDYTSQFGDDRYHTERNVYIVRHVGRKGTPLYRKLIFKEKKEK